MNVMLASVPSAQEMYNSSIPVILENAMEKISEAKNKGDTCCYIACSQGKIPAEVIGILLDAGYYITYHCFKMGEWFIKAFWENPSKKGKIFREGGICEPTTEVTIEDYKNT